MFNSPFFDTAIALVTLYLLFSQLTLSLAELPAGFLNTRGKYLYDRLREVLGPAIHTAFYAAATIQALALPKNEKNIFLRRWVVLWPAYISEILFAQTIMTVVAGTRPPATTPIAQFKAGLDTLPDTNFKETLQTLYTNAISIASTPAEQSQALQRNLESWFHDFGERLTGRYKRDNRKYLFLIGLLVAVLVDVDTVRLARFLADSNNAKARLALVSAGIQATQGAQPVETGYNPADPAEAAQYAQRRRDWNTLLRVANADLKNTLAAVPAVGLPLGTLRWTNTDVVPSDTTTIIDQATGNRVYAKPLPCTWAPTADDYQMPPYAQRRRLDAQTGKVTAAPGWHWLHMVGGWLLTAFALMIGAPFWFDTLCRFVNIRNTGIKPAPITKT